MTTRPKTAKKHTFALPVLFFWLFLLFFSAFFRRDSLLPSSFFRVSWRTNSRNLCGIFNHDVKMSATIAGPVFDWQCRNFLPFGQPYAYLFLRLCFLNRQDCHKRFKFFDYEVFCHKFVNGVGVTDIAIGIFPAGNF